MPLRELRGSWPLRVLVEADGCRGNHGTAGRDAGGLRMTRNLMATSLTLLSLGGVGGRTGLDLILGVALPVGHPRPPPSRLERGNATAPNYATTQPVSLRGRGGLLTAHW